YLFSMALAHERLLRVKQNSARLQESFSRDRLRCGYARSTAGVRELAGAAHQNPVRGHLVHEPRRLHRGAREEPPGLAGAAARPGRAERSEEHTSELQSRSDLVCRLLLEKKK